MSQQSTGQSSGSSSSSTSSSWSRYFAPHTLTKLTSFANIVKGTIVDASAQISSMGAAASSSESVSSSAAASSSEPSSQTASDEAAAQASAAAGWTWRDLSIGLAYYLMTQPGDDEQANIDLALFESFAVELDSILQPPQGDFIDDIAANTSSNLRSVLLEQNGVLDSWVYWANITALMNTMSLTDFILACNAIKFRPRVLQYEIAATPERNGFCLCEDDHTRSVVLLVNGTQNSHDLLTDLAANACIFRPGGHWSHKGMTTCANWFYKNLKSLILMRLKLQRKDGGGLYRLQLVGHSAGAGVASLLTLMFADDEDFAPFKDNISCLAFACPKVLSLQLARDERTKRLITSFVLNDDFIPRFSVEAFRDFRKTLGDWETGFWASKFGKQLDSIAVKAKEAGVVDALKRAYNWWTKPKSSSSSQANSVNASGDTVPVPVVDQVAAEQAPPEQRQAVKLLANEVTAAQAEVVSSDTAQMSRTSVRPPPSEFSTGIHLYPCGTIYYIRTWSQPKPKKSKSKSTVVSNAASPSIEDTELQGSSIKAEHQGQIMIDIMHNIPMRQLEDEIREMQLEEDAIEAGVVPSAGIKATPIWTPESEPEVRIKIMEADPMEFEQILVMNKKTILDHFASAYRDAIVLLQKKVNKQRSTTASRMSSPAASTVVSPRSKDKQAASVPTLQGIVYQDQLYPEPSAPPAEEEVVATVVEGQQPQPQPQTVVAPSRKNSRPPPPLPTELLLIKVNQTLKGDGMFSSDGDMF